MSLSAFEVGRDGIIRLELDFIADGGDYLYFRKGEDVGALVHAAYGAALEMARLAAQVAPSLRDAGLDAEHVLSWSSSDMGHVLDLLAKVSATIIAKEAIERSWRAGRHALIQLFERSRRRADLACDVTRHDDKELEHLFALAATTKRAQTPNDWRIIRDPTQDSTFAAPLCRVAGGRVRHRPPGTEVGRHRFFVNRERFALFLRTKGDRFYGIAGTDSGMQENLRHDFLAEWEGYKPDVLS